MRLYLAGPMRGIPLFNFPAFEKAAAEIRAGGHEVWSPAEQDVMHDGLDVTKHADFSAPPQTFSHYMRRDLAAVCDAEAVAVLPGWEKSKGARLEVHVARACDKPILDAHTLAPITGQVAVQVTGQEVRITDPTTGGQKGQKLARFDLIPAEPLTELAMLYGVGGIKYDDNNWRKGYKWGLSFAALMRHAWQFWAGESTDKETQRHHLASVAWHAFTLMWFETNYKDGDNRPK